MSLQEGNISEDGVEQSEVICTSVALEDLLPDSDRESDCGESQTADPTDSLEDGAHDGGNDVNVPLATCGCRIDAISCGHGCDLSDDHCCACVFRAPRPGLIPGLRLWWHQHGVDSGMAKGGQWRFYCARCQQAMLKPDGTHDVNFHCM